MKLLGYKRFHYRRWPGTSTDLPMVVLVHGRGECADVWSSLASCLRGTSEVIAPDLRGHGGTPWDPEGAYALADHLSDLTLLLDHWGRPVTLVGHGLGGRLALEAARRLPQLVEAVVVMDLPFTSVPVATLLDEASWESVPRDPSDLEELERAWRWSEIQQALTWPEPSGSRRPKCDPAILELPEPALNDDAIPSVRQPVLVLQGSDACGAGDVNKARQLARSLPDGRYQEVNGGRWPHIDNPSAVAEALVQLLTECTAPSEPKAGRSRCRAAGPTRALGDRG